MKKLLYVSFENAENRASGVNKKISGHLKAFSDCGYDTTLAATYNDAIAYRNSDGIFHEIKTGKSSRVALCEWVALNCKGYGACYIRFQFFCPYVLKMVKALKKNNVTVIMEIPTYPYEYELKKQGVKGIPKLICDRAFRYRCAKYIDSFSAPLYSDDIYKKHCIEIRNGIDVGNVVPKKPSGNDDTIRLLAVAMMAPWHGYQRMIEGINKYVKSGGTRKVELHLVGEGAATPMYRRLAEEYGLCDSVIIHGKLFGNSLDEMYDLCDIGVGSLGLPSKQLPKTNTLKVLEYMAKGLPVICEESEISIDKNSKYRLEVPSDSDPIDVNKVIDFFDSVYEDGRTAVIDSIRSECAEKSSVQKGISGVIDFFEKRCGNET